MATENGEIASQCGSECPIAKPGAPRMEASGGLPDRVLKPIDALAMVLAKTLPIHFISEFKKAHEEGVTLVALADAVLFVQAKRLSACGRCRDRLCRSCPSSMGSVSV